MKKILLIAIVFFISATSMAQIIFNLIVNAQPPAQLSEWGNRRDVFTLIATSPGAAGNQFKIKTEIKLLDGTVIGSADLARTPVFTISSTGNTILTANDAMPLEFIVFTGKYKTSLQKTGKLPADNYMICIQPVRPTDYGPLGEVQCKTFYLATTQLPILMKPYNEEILDGKIAQTAITFRWTPVVPRQTSPVTYRLQVFEVLPNQSPVQALRSNQPLLDKEILAATQYIWQPQLSFIGTQPGDEEDNLNKTKKTKTDQDGGGKDKAAKNINTSEDNLGSGHNKAFIWTIQSLDKSGLPVTQTDGNGEGRSEPIIFFVNPGKYKNPKKEN